jgi:hypothetical protein
MNGPRLVRDLSPTSYVPIGYPEHLIDQDNSWEPIANHHPGSTLWDLTPKEPNRCIAIGCGANTGLHGMNNIVLGTSSVFEGDWNIVIGCNNEVRGNHNVVIGDNLKVEGDHQTVINGLTETELYSREKFGNPKWDFFNVLSALTTYSGYHRNMHKAYELLNQLMPQELAQMVLEQI